MLPFESIEKNTTKIVVILGIIIVFTIKIQFLGFAEKQIFNQLRNGNSIKLQ